MELPDFLKLTSEQIAAEKDRQDSLRREFNQRVRMTPAKSEFARAMVLEESLKNEFENAEGEAKDITGNKVAENLVAQGRFIEAVQYAQTPVLKEYYEKIAAAVYDGTNCDCEPQTGNIGNTQIRLPKFHTIKEVYSLKHGGFGFIVECSSCLTWEFQESNPAPVPIDPADFDLNKTPNDLKRLRVKA